ncbi:hypothetical protein ACFPIJ_54615 [Dactylosporangium cerinum]|uniref:ABC transporter n=1 Tax=Dactylosporangium cerinum TaxID=1434730 RepID=A0ABV9WF24_9ACTN
MSRLAVVLPTLRATRQAPLLGAMAAGLAIVTVPAALSVTLSPDNLATLLRLGVACAAVGLAFLFDDPAKPTTATAPAPAWHGLAIRTTVATVAMALWWAGAIAVTVAGAQEGTGDHLPLPGLTLEAAALAAVAVAAAVVAWRFTPRGVVSPAAAPVVLVVVAALAFAPRWLSVFVSVTSPDWDAAHHRLAVLLACCLAAALAAATLRPTTRRRPAVQRSTIRRRSTADDTAAPDHADSRG